MQGTINIKTHLEFLPKCIEIFWCWYNSDNKSRHFIQRLCGFMQCAYNVRFGWDGVPIVARPEHKGLNIVFVVLFNQHEKPMRRIILSCVSCPNVLYFFFPNNLTNGTIFGKNSFNMKCVFEFFYNFVWNISNCKNNSARRIFIVTPCMLSSYSIIAPTTAHM